MWHCRTVFVTMIQHLLSFLFREEKQTDPPEFMKPSVSQRVKNTSLLHSTPTGLGKQQSMYISNNPKFDELIWLGAATQVYKQAVRTSSKPWIPSLSSIVVQGLSLFISKTRGSGSHCKPLGLVGNEALKLSHGTEHGYHKYK